MNMREYLILLNGDNRFFQLLIKLTIFCDEKMLIECTFIEKQTSYFKFSNKSKILEAIKNKLIISL
jgi:hypothetical protein